jgi:N-acetyltransferase
MCDSVGRAIDHVDPSPRVAKAAGSEVSLVLAQPGKEEPPVSFDYQPVLAGELVELRPLRPEDYDELCAVAADPLIWEQHPVRNRHEEATFRTFFQEARASGGALIVIDASSRRVIGSSRFHGCDMERSEVEIGWTFLARSHWGGRDNGEMKRLMLRHAFRFVSSVVFLVGLQNIRSQRAVERIGAVRVGTRPDASGRASHVYRITASAFEDRNGQPRGVA